MNAGTTPTSAGVLVVGAGEAGAQLAISLRTLGYDKPVVIVGDEPHRPYQRPPLSKAYLDGRIDDDGLALRTPGFYVQQQVDVLVDTRITRATVGEDGSGTATTETGRTIAFEHLALTTGARARSLAVPGADADGVHTLRHRDDAVALRKRLDEAERVAVIGTGYIGLEIAAVTRSRGLPTTLVEQEPRLLSRVGAEPISDFFLAAHRRWGSEFVLNAQVVAIEHDGGRARGVRLHDGRFVPADVVVVGIGAVPETGLARHLGLACRRGIVVDDACRTSHSGIVAAGDCTVQPHPHLAGELLAVESVQNAGDQARVAAATITGVDPPARAVPWFWSDQADLKLQIAGISHGHDRYVVRGGGDPDAVTVLYYRGGRLIAADAVNRPKDFLAVKRALAGGRTIDPVAATSSERPLKELIV